MINLKLYFTPGMKFEGTTGVNKDFHVVDYKRSNWTVDEVYPHHLMVHMGSGKKASFATGDLVMSGVLDGFVQASPEALMRRI